MGGITNETVHLSFAVDWSKEVNPLLYNNGNYNANEVLIDFEINRSVLDYLIQFIKENNIDIELSYKELEKKRFNSEIEDDYVIFISQKNSKEYKSALFTNLAAHIPNIKKDEHLDFPIPSNLDTVIKLVAYFSTSYKNNFDINEINKNPILIRIKSIGRKNTTTYRTIKAYLGNIFIFDENAKKPSYALGIATNY